MTFIPTYGYGDDGAAVNFNLVATWGYGPIATGLVIFDLVEFTLTLCRTREFDLER